MNRIAPYVDARIEAREFIYGVNGPPDLPMWLTAPIGLDELPPKRRFAENEDRLDAVRRSIS